MAGVKLDTTFEEYKKRLWEIMAKAEDCQAWPVALMIAQDLGDQIAANKIADKMVDRIKWSIPLAKRTPEVLKKEKDRVLAGQPLTASLYSSL